MDGNTPSGLEWYTPAREAGPPVPFASLIKTKRMKTDPALDWRLCRKDGCYMVCGSASMEVALSAARCAAKRFQIQPSINADSPLPFPTPNERIHLLGAYDLSPTRVYLNPYQYTKLAKKMGVTGTAVRKWFSDERMRQGHHTEYTKYPIQKRGTPAAVEVRTQLPLRRGRQPRAPQTVGTPRTSWTPRTKGEYVQEEAHQEEKMSVTWTEDLEQLTMYAYDPEAQEVPVNPQGVKVPRGCLILSDTGAESQDSGLGNPEQEIKENPIGVPTTPKCEPSKRGSPRDPRRRSVTMAPRQPCLGTRVCKDWTPQK